MRRRKIITTAKKNALRYGSQHPILTAFLRGRAAQFPDEVIE